MPGSTKLHESLIVSDPFFLLKDLERCRKQIVITGWGQITQPKNATPPFLDPLDMMEQAARAAGDIAGQKIWQALDSLLVVRTQSRDIARADLALAERLGLRVKHSAVSGIGGEVPQHYVNQAAGMLARGEAKSGTDLRCRKPIIHATITLCVAMAH